SLSARQCWLLLNGLAQIRPETDVFAKTRADVLAGYISQILKRARLLTHFDGAYLPPVCFVCAPSVPLCLCCRRVMRAQVRFRSSRTAMCNVPQPSQVSSMLSPSMNGLSPRWLVPVARMSPGCSV